MGQDWKTLSVVVVLAAIVGWIVVRRVTAPAHPETERVAAAQRPVRPPEPAPEVAPAEPAVAPPIAARTASVPSVAVPANGGDGDLANIDQDLAALAQALARDQRIEDRVMPRINDVLDVPGVTSYRRAPDFWEPALGGSGGMQR